jgi:hypothetical protein
MPSSYQVDNMTTRLQHHTMLTILTNYDNILSNRRRLYRADRHLEGGAMSSKKMFLSLVPWAVFAIVVNRHGTGAAPAAALAAAGLSLLFLARDRRRGGVKIIDVTGVVTFGAFFATGLAGGPAADTWIADYGRGSATAVLAVIMLASAVTVPFTMQYARETVPREYWPSPAFRSANRRISALWGGAVVVMAAGHLLAGAIDPPSDPVPAARSVDLLLNWALPAALVLLAVSCTQRISAAARDENPVPPRPRTTPSPSC